MLHARHVAAEAELFDVLNGDQRSDLRRFLETMLDAYTSVTPEPARSPQPTQSEKDMTAHARFNFTPTLAEPCDGRGARPRRDARLLLRRARFRRHQPGRSRRRIRDGVRLAGSRRAPSDRLRFGASRDRAPVRDGRPPGVSHRQPRRPSRRSVPASTRPVSRASSRSTTATRGRCTSTTRKATAWSVSSTARSTSLSPMPTGSTSAPMTRRSRRTRERGSRTPTSSSRWRTGRTRFRARLDARLGGGVAVDLGISAGRRSSAPRRAGSASPAPTRSGGKASTSSSTGATSERLAEAADELRRRHNVEVSTVAGRHRRPRDP